MSEFCLDCFNKYWGKDIKENEASFAPDYCEGCAEYKPCVIKVLPHTRKSKPFYLKRKKP